MNKNTTDREFSADNLNLEELKEQLFEVENIIKNLPAVTVDDWSSKDSLNQVQEAVTTSITLVNHMEVVQKELDSINKVILSPVGTVISRLEASTAKGKKQGLYSFWLGVLGIVLSFFTLYNNGPRDTADSAYTPEIKPLDFSTEVASSYNSGISNRNTCNSMVREDVRVVLLNSTKGNNHLLAQRAADLLSKKGYSYSNLKPENDLSGKKSDKTYVYLGKGTCRGTAQDLMISLYNVIDTPFIEYTLITEASNQFVIERYENSYPDLIVRLVNEPEH